MSSDSDSESFCSASDDASDSSSASSTSEMSSVANDSAVTDAETLVRLTKLVSLRGFGGAVPGSTPFSFISTRAREDERWLISLLSSPGCYNRLNESLRDGAQTLETVLRHSAAGFSETFPSGRLPVSSSRPFVERHRLLVETDAAPVVGNLQRHRFFARTVAAPEKLPRVKPQSSRSTNTRKGIKVVVVPDPKEVTKKSTGIIERTVASWDGHMRAVAAAQGSSVDQLRQESQTVKRFSDTEAFLGQAEVNEYNEQLRLEAIARDQEEKRSRRKRERAD